MLLGASRVLRSFKGGTKSFFCPYSGTFEGSFLNLLQRDVLVVISREV